jgi:hypothetical protein
VDLAMVAGLDDKSAVDDAGGGETTSRFITGNGSHFFFGFLLSPACFSPIAMRCLRGMDGFS